MGHYVVFVYADNQNEWNCSQWRALSPSNMLNRHQAQGWKGRLVHVSGFTQYLNGVLQDIIAPCDVVVVQRNVIHPLVMDAMAYWQGLGKPVVVDLDDGYHFLPWSNPARRFWFENVMPAPEGGEAPGAGIRMLEAGLRLSDGLVSPNRLLLSDWEYASGNSYFLPNLAEPWWWGVPPPGAWIDERRQRWEWREHGRDKHAVWHRQNGGPPRGLPTRRQLKAELGQEGRVVVGWGGSTGHFDGFQGSGLLKAVPRVAARHPETLWTICGGDRRALDLMDVPDRQKYHQPGVEPSDWPRVVARFDVGLAPLTHPYDQRRSWIKGIEYALAGTPWAATEGETYRDLAGWGTGLQGPETAAFWEDALETILADLGGWQERAEALLPEARRRFVIDNNLDVYDEVFGQIVADHESKGKPAGPLPNLVRIRPDDKDNGKEEETTEAPAGAARFG